MSGPVNAIDVKSLVEQFLRELAKSCPNNHYTETDDKYAYGEEFENDTFRMIPFSYDSLEYEFEGAEDNEDWNFTWKGNNFKVSWYKHIGRGMTYSRSISYTEFIKMCSECVASLTPTEESI